MFERLTVEVGKRNYVLLFFYIYSKILTGINTFISKFNRHYSFNGRQCTCIQLDISTDFINCEISQLVRYAEVLIQLIKIRS